MAENIPCPHGAASPNARRCRECGCTDDRACVFIGRRGVATAMCSWVEDDLCSACIPDIASLVDLDATADRWIHPKVPS